MENLINSVIQENAVLYRVVQVLGPHKLRLTACRFFNPGDPEFEIFRSPSYVSSKLARVSEIRPSHWTPKYIGDTASPRTIRVSEFTRRNGLETNFQK